jgi:hypothetical protein
MPLARLVAAGVAALFLAPAAVAKPEPPKSKDHVPPKPPGSLVAAAATTSVALSWTAAKDNKDVAGYRIYVDGARVGATASLGFVATVPCGSTHAFGVDAVDQTGNASEQATVSSTTRECPPPIAPAGLTASATTTGITVRWQVSQDAGVVGYGVYLDGALVTTTVATSYSVAVRCGTTHTLGIDAVASSGARSAPSTIAVTTPECEGEGQVLHVAPDGSDAGACLEAAPCATFDRAYRLATAGQRVAVAAGTYPTQVVRVDPTKLDAAANVVIAPADGARVSIAGDLIVYGSHVTFRDLKLRKLVNQGTAGAATSHDVVFDNLDGETFNIGPNYRITIQGGDWGPSLACHARNSAFARETWCPTDSPYAATGNDGGNGDYESHIGPDGEIADQWPHGIAIDGARIHDQNSLDLATMHTGGLFLISGWDIAIRNSVFQRNAVYDLQVQDFSTRDCCGQTYGPVRDAVLENNWFGAPVQGVNDPGGSSVDDGQPDVQLDPRKGDAATLPCWSNWLIRFNSFHNGLALGLDGPACFTNVRVVGNVGEVPSPDWWVASQCFPGAAGLTWAFNAWVGGACGPTDVVLPALPYASSLVGAENYRLTGGAAVDLVPGTDDDQRLGRDFEGQLRPLGGARDAGADELR